MPFKVLGLLFGNKENPAGGEGKGLGTSQRGAWPRPQLGYLLDGRVVVESGQRTCLWELKSVRNLKQTLNGRSWQWLELGNKVRARTYWA